MQARYFCTQRWRDITSSKDMKWQYQQLFSNLPNNIQSHGYSFPKFVVETS